MYNSSEVKQWTDALSTYQKAYKMYPDNGKPHAQIAMIESYRNNFLSMIYWYILSYCKFYIHPMAKDNLETFYKHLTEKSQSHSYMNENLKEFFLFLKLIHYESTTQKDFKNLYHHLSDVVSNSASVRQNIRNHQAICIILILENLVKNIYSLNKIISNYDNLTNFLFNSEENENNNFNNEKNDNNNSVFQLLVPINLCCIWIVNNSEIISIYRNYSKFYEENEMCYNSFKKALFNLVNSLNSITEIENIIEYLPEDCELLGFLPLRSYYSTIDFKSVNQIMNNDKGIDKRNQFYIRVGRIQNLIKYLVQVRL
ncbi:hypothetical protein BCR32DRAFT_251994 [Anaeromyces robustus]|uniref:DNA/RNA-binding domain-containing protein n=1 Tax=Anaeromyces robustus TaxID=1754192 RepID=A0A1Y1UV30_9FUNG|nr:hypothetical protein BCR32DRAFT_251994 [Anaeromyces robustus]|eukprot:ORX41829.1 hypothetical protein BCR32DRAFT_251994 [Anaeromyces robustus]